MRRHTFGRFETLEPRLNMAAVALFTDIDGDAVTVRTSRGTDTLLQGAVMLSTPGFGGGNRLERLDLSNAAFAGTNLTITAQPSLTGGNGRVDIGELTTSFDLDTVTIAGDVGRIVAGDLNASTPGIRSLTVDSIGLGGTTTGATSTVSDIIGAVPKIRVAGNMSGALFKINGRAADVVIGGTIIGLNTDDGFTADSIGRIVVRGSVWGGNVAGSGRVFASVGGIDRVVVQGDVEGGIGSGSGQISASGRLGSVRIDGFLRGNAGGFGGAVFAGLGGIGRAVIGRSIEGGADSFAGSLFTYGAIGTAVVGRSINGGSGNGSGIVSANAGIGKLTVGEDINGGIGVGSGIVSATNGRIGTLRVRNILSGIGPVSGSVTANTIGTITVGGSLAGSSSQPVTIAALGSTTATGQRAIDSIRVGFDVFRANIMGGYNTITASNGAARIGSVTIGRNFEASNIVAGVENLVTPGQFGVPGDVVSIGGTRGSRIGSITVGGVAGGTPGFTETFGVAANSIGRVRIGGQARVVTAAGLRPLGDNLLFHTV